MYIFTPPNSSKWMSKGLEIVEDASKLGRRSAKFIDLNSPDDDDGWSDCLSDNVQQSSAVQRLADNHSPAKNKKSKLGKKGKPESLKFKNRMVDKAQVRKAASPADGVPLKDTSWDSLWKCQSIADVTNLHGKWCKSFHDKALEGFQNRKLEDGMRSTIAALLSGGATGIPVLTGVEMLDQAWQFLHREIWASVKDDPEIEFAFVTFISGDGGTSLNAPFVELYHSREKVLKVLRSMAKDFIGVTELAMFNSHRHPDGGRHIQRHEHALIWGKDVAKKAKEVAKRRMDDFPPNISGARQIVVKPVDPSEINLARMCAYLFKLPYRCKNWNPGKNGKRGHMNQSEKGDRKIRYLRMAQICSMMTLEDIVFAGGAGVRLRSELYKLVEQTCRCNVPSQSRVLHPDEIGRFWLRANAKLKRSEWQLPVIARRA